MKKPLVVQTEHLDPAAAAWLAERCELVRFGSDEPGFDQLLKRADGLVIRTYTRVDAGFLDGAPRLKVVGRAGVGLDNVDLAACAARSVTVCNTPDANSTAVVEYVLALLLDTTRPRAVTTEALPQKRWNEVRNELKAERQLCELTLGIWGLGKIGKRIARVGAALGMRVIYHDLLEIPVEQRWGAEPVSRERLAAESDVLTLHVDGRRANTGMVGPGDFARMKVDVIFVNAARGFIVQNEALAGFLRSNPQALVLLDVHEPEPFGAKYPLLGVPNARLYPHIASSTALAHRNMSWVVKDVWRVLCGEEPEFPAAAEPV